MVTLLESKGRTPFLQSPWEEFKIIMTYGFLYYKTVYLFIYLWICILVQILATE